MESFVQGHRLNDDDLVLYLYARYISSRPDETFPYTPFWIRYNVGFIHPITNNYMLIGPTERIPRYIDTGKVRPNFIIDENWNPGTYKIRWSYMATDVSSIENLTVEFEIVSAGIQQGNLAMENHADVIAVMTLTD